MIDELLFAKNSTKRVDARVDFGATGDGKTDDTKALQAALDACKKTGGTIFVPSGNYVINACLIIYSNETLELDPEATIIRGSNATRYMVAVETKPFKFRYSGTHDVIIRGGKYDGGAGIKEKLTILNTCHARNILIENCSFVHGYYWHYIEINSTNGATVRNCHFDGTTYVALSPKNLSELVQIDTAGAGLYGPVYRNGKVMRFAFDLTPCQNITLQNNKFICDGTPAFGQHHNSAHRRVKFINNEVVGHSSMENLSRGYIVFTRAVHDVEIAENVFRSDMAEGTLNTGFTFASRKKTAAYIHDNQFYGHIGPKFVGGITEENNKFNK